MSNKCNHLKDNPTFVIDKSLKNRPLIIKNAQERLDKFYSQPFLYLERLLFLNHSDKERSKRSERREAIVNVSKVLMTHMQLDYDSNKKGFKVGIFKGYDASLDYFSYSFIQSKTGYTKKRIYRALKDLCNAGYIKMNFDISKNNNTFSTTFKIFIKRAFLFALKFKQRTIEKCIHFKCKSVEICRRKANGIARTAEQTMHGIKHMKSIKELLRKKIAQEKLDRTTSRVPL